MHFSNDISKNTKGTRCRSTAPGANPPSFQFHHPCNFVLFLVQWKPSSSSKVPDLLDIFQKPKAQREPREPIKPKIKRYQHGLKFESLMSKTFLPLEQEFWPILISWINLRSCRKNLSSFGFSNFYFWNSERKFSIDPKKRILNSQCLHVLLPHLEHFYSSF